jgi:hypothetical protein
MEATGNHLLAQSWTGICHLEQVSTMQHSTPDINMTMISKLKIEIIKEIFLCVF